MRLIEYGRHAVLAEYDDLDEVLRVAAHLRRTRPVVIDDVVIAARTILVRFDVRPAGLGALLQPTAVSGGVSPTGDVVDERSLAGADVVVLDVRYDGEDLAEVADRFGVTPGELIGMHTAPTYTVAFCGFAPGFGYLIGVGSRLQLARRPTPRIRVPAGSVAIAGPFTGVYPTAGPGGWHLLGRTDARLFDAARTRPALLVPGTRVRFAAT